MTPPGSPRHSEGAISAGKAGVVMVHHEQVPYPEKPSSQALLHQAPAYHHRRSRDPQLPSTPPSQPVRSLDTQEVRVEKHGVLKLTDFEVRGTLGKVSSMPPGSSFT